MKTIISAALSALILSSGAVLADDVQPAKKKPIELTAQQLDQVTAGELALPNGRVVFANFDNAAPGPLHPGLVAWIRRGFTGPDGPWQAHVRSPVINCNAPGCP